MMASTACLCLIGCKGKSDNSNVAADESQATVAEQTTDETQSADTESLTGELGEHYNLCPFCLQIEGKNDAEGNPVTENRQWIMGSSVGVATVADWVLYTLDPAYNLNVDGWHFVGKDIVNADETFKINDEDAQMSLSSFCTIRTEKYIKPEQVEAYEHVTFKRLYEVEGAEMEAPMLKTSGNRHAYKGEALEYVENKELQDKAITSFYLQEWVKVELPAELNDITLTVVRHQHQYEGVTYDADKLAESLWTGKAEVDEETGNATATFYVSDEQPVGFYDLLMVKDDKVQCYLSMVMMKEVAKK